LSGDERWYAVQTQARHENRVRGLIQQEIDRSPVSAREIREVLVPTQEVTEIRRGKRVSVVKPLYPGYVLVRMILNERTEHAISAMKGVRFVSQGGNPQPVREEDMNRIMGIEVEEETGTRDEIPFRSGQVVEVIQGPFTDFSGTVQEVYPEKGKVKVEVSLFGRPTSVELDFTQLRGF
jgi:transcriptional antiterminator NusG